MKIDIKTTVVDGETRVAGWDIIPETQDDEDKICVMRDAIFFGFGERAITYAGRIGDSNNKNWPIDKLMYRRQMYVDNKDIVLDTWEPSHTDDTEVTNDDASAESVA